TYALDALGHDTGEGCVQHGVLELLVGLRERRPRDFEVSRREITRRLRAIELYAGYGRARSLQALELTIETLKIELRARHACGLLCAKELDASHVEPGDDTVRFRERAGLRHPLDATGDSGRQIGGVARLHDAGCADRRRELTHLSMSDLDRRRALLLRLCTDRDGKTQRSQQCPVVGACAGRRSHSRFRSF